ncbi:MAG: metallopeptidase TldD-related protein [Gammaproteobacteria bacterium]|nr:metallopeptidase TldD-related protein [Gammaproteobacteria bacterium]
MRESFDYITRSLDRLPNAGEHVLIGFRGESSDFVRFNGTKIRQIGHVRQASARVTLIRDQRQASAGFDLSGDPEQDRARLGFLTDRLRDELKLLPADPFLHYATGPVDTERVDAVNLPDVRDAVTGITRAFDRADMTGIWASGDICAGFANSLGQKNWHSIGNFNFDFSVHAGDDSVKRSLSGQAFDPDALAAESDVALQSLAMFAQPARRLRPGTYRAYLAPAAVAEIIRLLSWNGFGLQNLESRSSPLVRMVTGDQRLDSRVSLIEDNRRGFAPQFTDHGFIKPPEIALIENGGHAGCLVGARSAREFGVAVNAGEESPRSLRMAPGALPDRDVLRALDTGIYVSNLWYCNFSERNDCRITGMTRFACGWVENGALCGPIEPMRFDDSLYRLLGDRLVDLTDQTTLFLDADTYACRSMASVRVPGVLVGGISLKL